MKKLLFLTNHSFMFWQFRRELMAELLSRGCDVTIGVPFTDHVEDFEAMGCRMLDIPVDRRGINPVTDGKLLLRYWKLLKAEKPDLVVTYSIKPNIYAGLVCRILGIPYCTNVQGLGTAFQKKGIAQLVTFLYRIALKKARVVFFENSANAQVFRDKKITPEKQQCLLRGAGINLDFYAQQPYPNHDRVHFLFLSRLMKEKGIEELFAAVHRLHQDGEDFFLDLVGFYEDGYKEQVEALEGLGICKFHGFQQNPRPYYAATDCVVLPSYHEGMSNVLLEAAATGRPVITSRIHGCMEAVDEGETGLLCTVKDTESLYEAMLRMAKLPAETRAAMGAAARQKMEREFEKSAVVQRTVRALMDKTDA